MKATKSAWEEYKADFNAMDDDEIEMEYQASINQMEEAESWVEAVCSWRAAGCPRDGGESK